MTSVRMTKFGMIELTFRKKMTDREIGEMRRWFSVNPTSDRALIDYEFYNPDGSSTWKWLFDSERDAAIFKLRFA